LSNLPPAWRLVSTSSRVGTFSSGCIATGYAAAVVLDGERAVRMDLDLDVLAVTGEGFVDRIVDDLVDAVVEAGLVRITDIHAGSFAHGLQALEPLDVGSAVAFVAGVLAAIRGFLGISRS